VLPGGAAASALNAGAGPPPAPPGAGIDVIRAVAQFAAHYPGVPYVSPMWPTADGCIPWRLFWLLYAELGEVLGLE
jgi:hypothetical protein